MMYASGGGTYDGLDGMGKTQWGWYDNQPKVISFFNYQKQREEQKILKDIISSANFNKFCSVTGLAASIRIFWRIIMFELHNFCAYFSHNYWIWLSQSLIISLRLTIFHKVCSLYVIWKLFCRLGRVEQHA